MTFVRALKESARLLYFRPKMAKSLDYDRYWMDKREGGLGKITDFQKARADWIRSRVALKDSLMDIGCGDGGILQYLKSKLNPSSVYAVDLSEYALGHLKSLGFDTVKYDLNDQQAAKELPPADNILILEVLEHLPNPEGLLEILTEKCRKAVYFSIPNTGFIAHRLRLLFGRFPLQWRLQPGEHLRFWTYSDLVWWVDQLGYTSRATIHCYAGFPVLNKIWPAMFSMGLIVEIKKKQNSLFEDMTKGSLGSQKS